VHIFTSMRFRIYDTTKRQKEKEKERIKHTDVTRHFRMESDM